MMLYQERPFHLKALIQAKKTGSTITNNQKSLVVKKALFWAFFYLKYVTN